MDLEMFKIRAAIMKQIRLFFDERGYLELDTPLLCDNLIPESCLEVFQTERLFPHGSVKENKPLWLIPSPEIWMKKIIAQHRVNVFQICKCFRNGESEGHLHNSEFTMLEYYTMNADYLDSLKITEELIDFLKEKQSENKEQRTMIREQLTENKEPLSATDNKSVLNSQPPTPHSPLPTPNSPLPTPHFLRITAAEAFSRWAGFDLFEAANKKGAMEKEAQRLGLEPMPGMTVPELYDLIFIHAVEPQLKMEKPIFLLDYPAFVPCLAKSKEQRTESNEQITMNKEKSETVERWELYWNGVELANCFSEETDPQKVRDFFTIEAAEKEKSAIVRHKVDHDYWKLFEEQSFPRCSGVAMGVDRLIMALTGRRQIDGVTCY